MPLYDFHCEGCDQTTERRERVGVDEIECPSCGATARRQFAPNKNLLLRMSFHTNLSDFQNPFYQKKTWPGASLSKSTSPKE